MKRRLLISLVAVLCCIGAWGQTGPADNEIWYTSTDGEPVEFDFTTIGTPIKNEQPEGKDYYVATFASDVTALKHGQYVADYGNYPTLKTITLPACLKSICENVFHYIQDLESITFADGSQLETIGECCFEKSGLKSICIPKGVKEIPNNAFNSCESLKTVTFAPGSQLETIGEGAFYNTPSVTSTIVIPASVKTIGYSAFDYCWAPSITLAAGSQLEIIGEAAFCSCQAKIFTIPASVTTIESGAFAGARIGTVIFEGTPTNIADDAFDYIGGEDYFLGEEEFFNVFSTYSLLALGEEKTDGLTDDEKAKIIEAAEADGWDCYPFQHEELGWITLFEHVAEPPILTLPGDWEGKPYVEGEPWYGGLFALAANAQEVTEVGWTSMYLDYNYTLPMGAVAFYASKSEGNKITLEPIKGVIPANTGVVIKAEKNCVLCATKTDKAPTTTITGNLLQGVTVDTPVTEEVYVLSPATTESCPVFQNYTGTTLGANKAYIRKSDVTAGDVLNFEFGGTATAIDNVTVKPGKASSVRYNLNGQAVGADYKGIVIVNGKKVLNK